jgi:hypothetical protein
MSSSIQSWIRKDWFPTDFLSAIVAGNNQEGIFVRTPPEHPTGLHDSTAFRNLKQIASKQITAFSSNINEATTLGYVACDLYDIVIGLNPSPRREALGKVVICVRVTDDTSGSYTMNETVLAI